MASVLKKKKEKKEKDKDKEELDRLATLTEDQLVSVIAKIKFSFCGNGQQSPMHFIGFTHFFQVEPLRLFYLQGNLYMMSQNKSSALGINFLHFTLKAAKR